MSSVALVMIARDEERCIGRALASAAPYVDRMLVLDTGSTDDTVAIARAAGAIVDRAEWRDDFAAARNAALAMSDAAYNLMLDADEWIESGGPDLRAWCTTSSATLGLITRRDVLTAASGILGDVEAVEPQVRVLKRGVGYIGRVHEQPDSLGPVDSLDLVIGHDGYLDEHNAAKAGRNERLLRLQMRDSADPVLTFQLARDLEIQGRFEEAVSYYSQALTEMAHGAPLRHTLVVRAIFSFKSAGRHEEAMSLFAREAARWPDSPDLFFAAGDLFLDAAVARPASADEFLTRAKLCWSRCLELGDRPELAGSVRGRGSHLARHNLDVLQQHWPRAGT